MTTPTTPVGRAHSRRSAASLSGRTVATRGPVKTHSGHRLVTNDDGPGITDGDHVSLAWILSRMITHEAGQDNTRKEHSICRCVARAAASRRTMGRSRPRHRLSCKGASIPVEDAATIRPRFDATAQAERLEASGLKTSAARRALSALADGCSST